MDPEPSAPSDRIAIALDVPTVREADLLAASLVGAVGWFKIGLELYLAHGPESVTAIRTHGPVFLDVKLHDIPTTVGRTAARIADLGVGLVTVHASGGAEMVHAAVEGLHGHGRVLAVTVLSSMSDEDLAAVGLPNAAEAVPALARLAVDAGATGLVCAPNDLRVVRETVGPDVLLVAPGIRESGTDEDDHARAATAATAVADGADLLVIGRPISKDADPAAAARRFAEQVAAG